MIRQLFTPKQSLTCHECQRCSAGRCVCLCALLKVHWRSCVSPPSQCQSGPRWPPGSSSVRRAAWWKTNAPRTPGRLRETDRIHQTLCDPKNKTSFWCYTIFCTNSECSKCVRQFEDAYFAPFSPTISKRKTRSEIERDRVISLSGSGHFFRSLPCTNDKHRSRRWSESDTFTTAGSFPEHSVASGCILSWTLFLLLEKNLDFSARLKAAFIPIFQSQKKSSLNYVNLI